ncbi:MAG: chemotaxis protein CheW [Oleiphilaceae bacterium]|nr:chemotaxis protein CheW [Oleiphilaceae bacterium]
MSETLEIISSLYLPVSNAKLLLPNVTVAEVVAYQEPKTKKGAPDYFLGTVAWRGIEIPLLSYEIANGAKSVKPSKDARIAVINTIGEHSEKLPFFAIVTQGIPRLVKVSDELIKKSRKKGGDADLMLVRLDGEDAVIPNVTHLESLLLPLLPA